MLEDVLIPYCRTRHKTISDAELRPVLLGRTAGAQAFGFGAAGLVIYSQAGIVALLRFGGGPGRAGMLLAGSLALWLAVPMVLAVRRLSRADI